MARRISSPTVKCFLKVSDIPFGSLDVIFIVKSIVDDHRCEQMFLEKKEDTGYLWAYNKPLVQHMQLCINKSSPNILTAIEKHHTIHCA